MAEHGSIKRGLSYPNRDDTAPKRPRCDPSSLPSPEPPGLRYGYSQESIVSAVDAHFLSREALSHSGDSRESADCDDSDTPMEDAPTQDKEICLGMV